MTLTYYQNDERPAWQPTITENGVSVDYSSGYTFEVKVYDISVPANILLTKTTNITGATGGVVQVSWASGELNLSAGTDYRVQLKITRSSDSTDATITEGLVILARV